jgi:hypothetical protein
MGKQAYKLDLTDYTIPIDVGGEEPELISYNIRKAIVGLLTHTELRLNGLQLVERYQLIQRIKDESVSTLLLNEQEYGWLRFSTEVVHGFGEYDYEMLTRVFNAERVEVETNGEQQ